VSDIKQLSGKVIFWFHVHTL